MNQDLVNSCSVLIEKLHDCHYRWVTSREEDCERRRQVDVLIAKSYQNAASGSSQFTVQHRIQNRIVTLDVLHQQRIAKTKSTLEVLAKCIVKKTTHTRTHTHQHVTTS